MNTASGLILRTFREKLCHRVIYEYFCMKKLQNVVEIVHNNVQKVLINSLHSNFWKKFIKMWFFSPKNPYPALKKKLSKLFFITRYGLMIFASPYNKNNKTKRIIKKYHVTRVSEYSIAIILQHVARTFVTHLTRVLQLTHVVFSARNISYICVYSRKVVAYQSWIVHIRVS